MTKQNELPVYFEKMLDEKFGRQRDLFHSEIGGVMKAVKDVKADVAGLKKKVGSSDGKISRLWLAVLIIIIVLLVHFGETEAGILKIFKFI